MRLPSGLNATLLTGRIGAAQDQGLARAIGIPYPHRLVLGRGDDALAVGAEHRRIDPVLVTTKDQGLARAVGVPHPRGLVPGRGDDALAVGAERRRTDRTLVTTKDQRLARTIGVPHTHGLVAGGRNDALAVGAERRRTDRVLVTTKHQGLARSRRRSTPARSCPMTPVTMRWPSGLNAAERDRILMTSEAPRDRPTPSAFHTRAVLSDDAVTMRLPSGLNAAE